MTAAPRIAIAAGGTAGHVVPALAIADALRAEGAEVAFVGGERAEAELVPAAGYPFHRIAVEGLHRRNPVLALRAALRSLLAVLRSVRLLRSLHAQVVLGGGGYVAGPVGLAAVLLRVPLVLTEADSHLGVANRLLAPFARRVCLAFPLAGREGGRYLVTGRPVPPPAADRLAARARFGLGEGDTVVLVFGGSLGARSINEASVRAFADAPFRILHAAGVRDFASLEAPGPHYDLRPYIDGFGEALAAADLVVARSGGSVFEIAAAGKPAILIPYPHAAADHQTANAAWMERAGAAVLLPDAELSPERLRAEIDALLGEPARLAAMADASAALARPHAAQDIAAELLAAVRGDERTSRGRMDQQTYAHRAPEPADRVARVRAVTPWAGRKLHFVGIGGAGMSGLALVACALGAEVSGSDHADSPALARLRELGVATSVGHDGANVPDGAEVVYSTAIPADNPERATGAPELHRADLLGEVTTLKRCIAVTGTHGKTTTSSMVVHALRGCGLDPSYLVGGEVRSTGSNAGWGAGEWVVVEADESDRSLLKLHPDIAVLTNAELDHHSTYASRLDVDETFRQFLARASEAVVVWDRPELTALAPQTGPDVVAYDVPHPALDATGARFDWRGISVQLTQPGAHNALNAAAALEACRLAGADPAQAAQALADFRGAGRRFELLGTTTEGATVYDDYAHHPTEVAATIAAARTLAPARVVAVFQPHLYSRTQALAADFGAALAAADLAVVLDVYPARERAQDFPGVSGLLVAEAAADAAGGRTIAWLPGFDAAERFLRTQLRPSDVCLAMGAGDVDALGRRLVA